MNSSDSLHLASQDILIMPEESDIVLSHDKLDRANEKARKELDVPFQQSLRPRQSPSAKVQSLSPYDHPGSAEVLQLLSRGLHNVVKLEGQCKGGRPLDAA
jgi:hypothetical protein